MSIYYPPGTGPNDRKAPWNQEVKYKECDECEGSGKHKAFGESEKCAACDGTGEIEVEDDDEIPW
jgi:DnaJ-class molecular chaperone